MNSLIPVIRVDEGKCVNCHACISACPVKYCNDGSGSIVAVNHDMCIACGNCISACTHEARGFIDDFDRFISDLISGEEIIAIVAPAIAAAFPDKYLNFNTILKEHGVKAIFDVSFGAELAAKSYIDFISSEKPQSVIAQPCAAIVTYIELYQPELLKYLAPVDSPMLHTMKMVKNFYPQFKNCKIAIISPCNAKKREFIDTGLGDYNIAQKSIDEYLKKNKVDLSDFPPTEFDNPPAERAVLFSSPGGLLETAKRWVPEIEQSSRKIEGIPLVYDYLKALPEMIDRKMSPLLIDCLSCEYGCNGGPLTITKQKPQDEVEYWVRKRARELKEKYLSENENKPENSRNKIESIIDSYWEEDLYARKYINRWENVTIDYPTKSELKSIYASMRKYTDEDIKNCTSCGYFSCESMATAIKNGLNKPENCHYYLQSQAKSSYEALEANKRKFENILDTMLAGYVEIDLDGVIIDANPAMKQILLKRDIVGRTLIEFIDHEYVGEYKNQVASRKKGKKGSYEVKLIQSDGHRISCLLNGSPRIDSETGKVCGSFALVTDISELKQMQNELNELNQSLEEKVAKRTEELSDALEEIKQVNEEMKQQQEEILAQRDSLEDSERRIRTILLSIPDAVFIISKEGIVTFWNSEMEKLTGISADDILGKGQNKYSLPFFGRKTEMLIDLVKQPKELIDKNYPGIIRRGEILQNESYIRNLKGQDKYLIGIATAIYDNDGNYDGAIEVIHDETEKRKAFEVLSQQKLKLEEKQLELDEKIDELLATTEIVEAMNLDLQQQHLEIEMKNEVLTIQTNEISEKNQILEIQKNAIIEQHKIAEEQNTSIKNSIEYAKRIQFATLKTAKDLPFSEHFILFRPRDIVSGDFYLFKKFMNYTVIVAADCTGHGVPGAFMSLLGISLLNDLTARHFRKITRNELSASKILDDLRDSIIKTLNQNEDRESTKDGMDMVLCIFDEDTKELQFAGAYNPLLIIRDNKILEYKGDKMPIGIHFFKDMTSRPFTNHKLKLQPNDCMYMFSDGYHDQYGEASDRKFIRKNFYQLLLDIHKKPLTEQLEILENTLNDYQGVAPQTDDILVLGFKY